MFRNKKDKCKACQYCLDVGYKGKTKCLLTNEMNTSRCTPAARARLEEKKDA